MKKYLQAWKKYRLYIVGAVLLFAIIYSFLNKDKKGPPVLIASPSPTSSAAAIGSASPIVEQSPTPTPTDSANESLVNGPVLSPRLYSASKIISYFDFNEEGYQKFGLDTRAKTELLPATVYITNTYWSPDGTQILIRLSNETGRVGENPFFQPDLPYGQSILGHYSFDTKQFKLLNTSIAAVSWLDNSRIIYQYRNDKVNNLSIAKPDGSGWKDIARLSNDVEIISAGQTALVKPTNSNEAARYGSSGKVLEKITVPSDLTLSQSAWLESGPRALYLVTQGAEATVKQLQGRNQKVLVTLPGSPDLETIMWDNESNAIYLAGFDGLIKLGTTVEP